MTYEWKLKDVLMIAICGVLFGVICLASTYSGGFLSGLLTPAGLSSLGYEPFYGFYFMAGAFGIYVMRKPGTGVIAELLAAVIECLMGNYFGPIIIVSGLIQGIGFELIFALKKYKKFDMTTMIEGAVICSAITMLYNVFFRGYNKIAVGVLLLMIVVRLISTILIDAFLTKTLADKLADAGVLKGYAIGQNAGQDIED